SLGGGGRESLLELCDAVDHGWSFRVRRAAMKRAKTPRGWGGGRRGGRPFRRSLATSRSCGAAKQAPCQHETRAIRRLEARKRNAGASPEPVVSPARDAPGIDGGAVAGHPRSGS